MGRVNVYYRYVVKWVQRQRDIPSTFVTPAVVKEALYSLLWYWLKNPETMEMISLEIDKQYQKRNIQLLQRHIVNDRPRSVLQMEKLRIERLIGRIEKAQKKDEITEAIEQFYFDATMKGNDK